MIGELGYSPEERFRLYLVPVGEPLPAPAAYAPDMAGIGTAIQTLHEDEKLVGRRLSDRGIVGVYDALEREWIVLPFVRAAPPIRLYRPPVRGVAKGRSL